MARTLVPVVSVSRFALVPTVTPAAVDPTNLNYALNDGSTVLEFTNTDASTHPLHIGFAEGVDGYAAGQATFTLPVSAVPQRLGPFPQQSYGPIILFDSNNVLVKVAAYSYLTVQPA